MNLAVIFAGGTGSRMHSKERPKQFLELYNKPIIIHTLEHFDNAEEIDEIIVVCREQDCERIREIATLKVLGFRGGEVGSYISKEIFLLSLIGGVIGLPLGVLEHHFIMTVINRYGLLH